MATMDAHTVNAELELRPDAMGTLEPIIMLIPFGVPTYSAIFSLRDMMAL